MRKEFLKGVPAGNEGKAVKAFVEMNKENMLKTKPKVSASLCCAVLRSIHFGGKFPDGLERAATGFLPIGYAWGKKMGLR